jgi:hypothetical protein
VSIILTGPTNQTKFDIIDSIIQATGRIVSFVLATLTLCPVCGGTNPFCTTCNGQTFIDTTNTITKTASVRWGKSEKKIYQPQGQDIEGDCLIVFSTEDTEDTDHMMQQTRSILIDNRVCVIDKWYYKGQPINRCYVVLNEDKNLSGNRIG